MVTTGTYPALPCVSFSPVQEAGAIPSPAQGTPPPGAAMQPCLPPPQLLGPSSTQCGSTAMRVIFSAASSRRQVRGSRPRASRSCWELDRFGFKPPEPQPQPHRSRAPCQALPARSSWCSGPRMHPSAHPALFQPCPPSSSSKSFQGKQGSWEEPL